MRSAAGWRLNISSEIREGETFVNLETIVTYTRDAAGRPLRTRRDTGAMTTAESIVCDQLGRPVVQTDLLGRVTTTAYSEDGLTTTVTTPAGAILVTELTPTAASCTSTARDSAKSTTPTISMAIV